MKKILFFTTFFFSFQILMSQNPQEFYLDDWEPKTIESPSYVNTPQPIDPATVTMTLPPDQKIRAYFMYGPTPDNPVAHWYRFDFDGETGAELNGNIAVLHFVDGMRGDSDLLANGVIVDPGTPALTAENSAAGGGGSSGCSIAPGGHDARPSQAGAWCLMVLLLGIQGLLRLRASRHTVLAGRWRAVGESANSGFLPGETGAEDTVLQVINRSGGR